jgi:lipoic acid synthetase
MIELPVISSAQAETPAAPAPVAGGVKKPNWLRVKLPTGEGYRHVRGLVDTHKLHTICESGNCPNMGECWGAGTATFMILGNICTRSCGFCAVATGAPGTCGLG